MFSLFIREDAVAEATYVKVKTVCLGLEQRYFTSSMIGWVDNHMRE